MAGAVFVQKNCTLASVISQQNPILHQQGRLNRKQFRKPLNCFLCLTEVRQIS